MVNPDELMPTTKRESLENFEKGSLKAEAKEGSVKRRIFGKDVVDREKHHVYLPILIIPGVASSGLVVEKSSLDKKYEGRRLWMNPGFLAGARFNSKVFNEDEIKEHDGKASRTFAMDEEDLAISNAWIHHIGLDKNMIDEKPGNRVRPYEGLFGCEYLVDDAVAKTSGWVMAPMVDYCVRTMGYEKVKSVDAMPYDWRLAPSINEKRDGYLTKMIERVERMYQENDKLPIVLICHSMGAKMGHYFLNFAKFHKGQEWLDKYIHTYMPIGAPHGGVGCAVRTGITGKGLDDMVDALVGNRSDGLQMYRRWSCGNWLMPRMLPKGVFPTCIVRREGELGVTVSSEIEVGLLFANQKKPPKDMRLKVVFRDLIHAYTDFQPVIHNKSGDNPKSMIVSFDETFYIAVPNLGKKIEIGELNFHLEEPAGNLHLYKSRVGKVFSNATVCARGFKKKMSACARSLAKKWGSTLKVASCDQPLRLRVSDFAGDGTKDAADGKFILDKTVPMIRRIGGNQSIGSMSLRLMYSPPPESTGSKVSTAPIAMTNSDTPNPPIMRTSNVVDNTVYDVMNGTDVFKADGFVDNMFDLVENVYEKDPLGPTKESSLDAPPVKCVRSIYGINVETEAGAIYRKVPVVTVGDSVADHRYMLDTEACLNTSSGHDALKLKDLLTYNIKGGIVYETPDTLQDVPGKTEQRRVCGDGTVPYWNMIHALTWKDKVDVLTVDELNGASHRAIIADERCFALLKRYCRVIDPRANAMMIMKKNMSNATVSGIGSLALEADDYRE